MAKHLVSVCVAGMLLASAAGMPVGAADIASEALPVHRFWSPVLGVHFYTISEGEKQELLDQPQVWLYEGIAFQAFSSGVADSLAPVHRFVAPASGAHFYTLKETEKDKLLRHLSDVWTYAGVAFHAYAPGRQPEDAVPVHRFWSGPGRTHFYTASDTERFKLVSSHAEVWDYEGVAWYAHPRPEAAPPAIVKGPFVREVTPDAALIMWQSNTPLAGLVDYGIGAAKGAVAAERSAATLHQIMLTGLEPGTVYHYQVTSGPVSQAGQFRTAPRADQTLRLAVYGDTRTDVHAHRQVAAGIAASKPDMVFHTGDLVGAGRQLGVWDTEFFEPAGELLRRAPLVPVPGNHEYAGKGPPWFYYFFHRPLNEAWFALTYGNVRVIGLDSNADYTAGSVQHKWLLQELQSDAYRTATWHIVILHHPPFTCAAGRSDDAVARKHLVPLFEQYGVDLVFSGHSHLYERYLHQGIHYIVTGGGGAPLYTMTPDLTPPLRQFGRSVYHHCVVDVDPSAGTLVVSAIDLDRQIFDGVKLSKSP